MDDNIFFRSGLFGPGGLFGDPAPAHPIEESIRRVEVQIQRSKQFATAAWVASPNVAAVMFGEAESAMIAAAEAYADAKRLAAGLTDSVELTVATARKKVIR